MASLTESISEDTVIVIIGGGLSGLVTAKELDKACNAWDDCPITKIVVLEARDRFGGRIYSEHGVDLGPSWTWPAHDKALNALAKECGVPTEDQYVEGNALMHRENGQVVPFARNESPAGSGSKRFRGGPSAIISCLVRELSDKPRIDLQINAAVRSISSSSDGSMGCSVVTYNPVTRAERDPVAAAAVVVAMPLQLIARSINIQPSLPAQQLALMDSTETWMGNTGKVGFVFEKRFWKDRDISGTVFSETGPMSQIWDASTADVDSYALSSFVFDTALDSLKDPERALHKDAPFMTQLVRIFGPQAKAPAHIVFKAWNTDPFTVINAPASCPVLEITPFGHPGAMKTHHNIVFSGTESCLHENGHMNGAVLAGMRAAKDILALLRKI